MDTSTIRQQLHNYLEEANDKKVKAIYTMVEDEIKESGINYTEEFKADLDRRVAYYVKGGRMVSPKEMQKRIKAISKQKNKNAL